MELMTLFRHSVGGRERRGDRHLKRFGQQQWHHSFWLQASKVQKTARTLMSCLSP